MLIYDHNFEFIGIDKEDLNKLGFKTFSDLKSICNDFADLFVKKPGYIHNFKNLKWILYILNSDTHEAKAIIEANGTTFTTELVIHTLYMIDNPDKESYIVTLSNLHKTNNTTEPIVQINENVVSSNTEVQKQPLIEPEAKPQTADDSKIQTVTKPDVEHQHTTQSPMLGDYLTPIQPTTDKQTDKYVYDPKIAADELGLPIDLVEEFIGDFIQQAYSFKDGLYSALDNEDRDTLKNLSHKLKGVAANLRIEDAFEAIRVVNDSSDMVEARQNLDTFYSIIHKLDKKEQPLKATQNITKPQDTSTKENSESIINDDIYANLLQDEDLISSHENKTTENIQEVEDVQNVQNTQDLKESENIEIETEEALPTAPTMNIVMHYDKQKAINELGLDEDALDDFIKNYKTQLISSIKDIQDAAQSGNLAQVHQLALNIKGTSDNLRLLQISTLLEQLIFTNSSQEVDSTITALQQCLDQI